jgi:(p)ppGpp synthase/HD superfamily hydrolase
MSNLTAAIMVATSAHNNQIDKSGEPYILHPLRVMLSLDTEEERIVGVLHDVIEDTHYTFKTLEDMGFSDRVLGTLDALSRDPSKETHREYIRRVSLNSLAVRVKLKDLEDNMSVNRLKNLPKENLGLMKRYAESWQFLSNLEKV